MERLKTLKIWGLFLCLLSLGESRRMQQFSLYSISEQIENYTKNVDDLDIVSQIVRDNQLQSVCSQMGVWAFFTGKNYTTVNSYGYHPATTEWTCSKRRIMADWQSPFRSIRHLGNADLDTPSLSLFKDPFFASEELYVNGHELSFSNSQFDFGSFGFTGRESWTLYAEPNFQGDTVCLQCKCDPVGLSIGVTYTAKLTLSASSIRRGCFGNQVLQPSGILEKRVPSGFESNLQNRNSIALTLSHSTSNSSLTFSGTELRLPCLTTFDTFQISGRSNWTVFSGPNFDGPSACLVYSANQYGRSNARIRVDFGSDPARFNVMSIASIRNGCPQNLAKKGANPIPAFVAPGKQSGQAPPPVRNPGQIPPRNTIPAPPPYDRNSAPAPPPYDRNSAPALPPYDRNPAQATPSPTQASREGRGRELGPSYIPGDIEGFGGFRDRQRLPPNIPIIVNYQPTTPQPKAVVTPPQPLATLPPVTTQQPFVTFPQVTTQQPQVTYPQVPTQQPATFPEVNTRQPFVTFPEVTTRQPPATFPEVTTRQPPATFYAGTTLRPSTFPQETPKPFVPPPPAEVTTQPPFTVIPDGTVPPRLTTHSPHQGSTDSTHENLVEPNQEKPVKKDSRNDVDAPIRHASSHEAATIGDDHSGSAGMFFTAFLIILGILVTAMVVTIAVFIYLRASRSAEADIE